MARNILNKLLDKRINQLKAKTKTKTLTAATPTVDDPTLQTWIKEVSSTVKDIASSGVRRADLVRAGIATMTNGELQNALSPPVEVNLTVPAAVLSLTASGAYSSNTLTWETRPSKFFGQNNIYRAEVDDFGMAAQIGSTLGDVYTDYVGNGIKAYYWVRTISKFGVEGQLSQSVTAETSVNIPYLLEQLTDKITNSHLAQSLKTQIEKIELISIDLGTEINNRIQQAQELALSFSNLQNELTNGLSDNSAAITNVQTTLNSKIENIAQEISLVTAGVGEQFDTFKIWFFDEGTTEGWTSSGGVPEVQNGWIRAFLNGTDTTLISPPDNNFSGSAYPDIRFRVKRVGNPQWNATISWGEGFNLYVSIPEPIWNEENGIGTIQKNVDWTGNIGQIKLKLAVTQDESNYYVLDWFAFGRPSPAASWSAIGEVKTAIANEMYARTQYQNSNEAKWANNDVVYRGLIQEAIDMAADENGITAQRLDNFIVEGTTRYAGDDEEYAGDDSIYVGHVTEEVLRIEGDNALLEEIEIRAIQIDEKFSAAIQEESRIRTDQNSVLVEQINTMQSKVDNDISAAIQEERRLRTDQDLALAEQIETLQVQVGEELTAAIQNESLVRAEQNSVLAQQINNVQATANGATSGVQQAMTAIAGINAEWKVKVQANGVVSGVTLGVNGSESDFIVLTNRFSVVSPNGWVAVPFVIDSDGRTIMNTAVIKDGSIESAKIGSLSADKITAGNIAADRMKANIVAAVSGQFTSLSAITGTIGVLRTATYGARTEIRDNLIEVYDSAGRVRVRLGVW